MKTQKEIVKESIERIEEWQNTGGGKLCGIYVSVSNVRLFKKHALANVTIQEDNTKTVHEDVEYNLEAILKGAI